MSEKTAWEVARDAYFDVKQTKHCPSGSVMGRERISWQAAAAAIATPLLARIAELEGERDQAQEANAHLISELRLARKGFEAVDQMRVEALSDAEAAYHRGVAEERERCAKVAEGLTRFLSCGGGNGHGIAESIRSASPAVDVTSDKGGER